MARIIGAVVLLLYAGAAWAAGPPDRETWERFGKIERAARLNSRGVALYQAGRLAEAVATFAEVLEMNEAIYPKDRYPQGHPHLAAVLSNLASLHQARGDYAEAEPRFRLALEMNEAMFPRSRYPRGHPDLAACLNNLALLHWLQGEYAKAEPLYVRGLLMSEGLYPRSRYPRGHVILANSLNNLAALYEKQSDYARAAPLYARALKMYEAIYPEDRYPRGHPDLAGGLNNMASLHEVRGDYAGAEPLFRRALEMNERLYPTSRFPDGHFDLALSVNNLAALHEKQGDSAKAESLYRRGLEMNERLYPKTRHPRGHPDLATSLNNLAALTLARGDFAKAEALYLRALEMREGLYPATRFPQGHPELAQSLNNLAGLRRAQGDYAEAEPLYARALRMYGAMYPRSRYPRGHPDLANTLNNLASLWQSRGRSAKAEALYLRALEMREGLYPATRFPQGHHELAQSLNNLASLHQSRGEYAEAEPLYARALRMYRAEASSLAGSVSEATALNYLASQPYVLGAYLSVTSGLPGVDAYLAVWPTKAALARVVERRHLAVLAASSAETRKGLDAILALRLERARLLLAPSDAAKAKARDARLDEIDEAIRKNEAAMRPLLPELKRSADLASATPADLRKALPAGTAFVDLVRHVRSEPGSEVRGAKGEKHAPHYVAFVVTRAGVARVELGEAKPIEDALDLWRRAVVEGSPAEPKYAAEVHRLLWSPLLKHLPAKTSAVFVSPDAALHRLPWAALRDPKTNRVLIEDYAVATIPHGPMLLDRLTGEKRKAPDAPTLLAMGGVAYDKRPGSSSELAMRGPVGDAVVWSPLGGTAKELEQIAALKGGRRLIRREGESASAQALLDALPRAQTAHLATHGFFADAKFRTVFQLDPKLFERTGRERNTAGARSPMVLSGLVCAGANVEGTPNRGVVTADAIVGLDLRKLDLAVLSACETGLGDVAGGEGVYGLVRAFHVAGTRNVVASLWKVDDEATAALMVLFYREMWGREKVSPMEALRRAQLAVYRDPDRVPEWAAGRGPLPRPVAGGVAKGKGPRAKTSPARAWAAFVISGPGD